MLMYAALALDKYLNARDAALGTDDLEDPMGIQVSPLYPMAVSNCRLFYLTERKQ
jgi:hypothetical protein